MSAATDGKSGIRFAGDACGGFIFPELQPAFDTLFAFAKTLEMLALQDLTLSGMRAQLPAYFTSHVTVRCPWELKGKVMRVLTEENSDQKIEMLDGIKVHQTDGSWALVLPDANEPIVHIYAEGASRDSCDALAHRYALKVTALRG
jgi:mannose-1-phosphate guanylyltransferase/phosphomannomutase